MLYLARDHMTNGSLFQEAEHMFFKKFSCWCGWWGWIQRQLCEFQRHRMRCFWVSLLDWPTCLIVEASEAWRGSVIFQRSQGWFVVLIIQLLPVLLCLLCSEVAQTYVHRVNDAIQPSHLLSPPSPLALNLSQHQDLFQWVGSSHQVTKVLELQLQHQSWCWKDHIFPTQLCHTPPKQQTPLCSLCRTLTQLPLDTLKYWWGWWGGGGGDGDEGVNFYHFLDSYYVWVIWIFSDTCFVKYLTKVKQRDYRKLRYRKIQ